MRRSVSFLWLILAVLFLTASNGLTFQEPDQVYSAKVTKQKFLDHDESMSFLERSPAWQRFKEEFGEHIQVAWNVNSGTPHRIVTSGINLASNLNESNIVGISDRFISDNSDLLGVSPSDLRLQTAGFHGRMWYVIYDRYYDGLPVYNARVNLTYHSNGNLVSFGSDTYPGIKIDTTPRVSENRAMELAHQNIESSSDEDKVLSTQLLVLPLEIGDDFSVHLAWKIVYYCPDPLARWFMFIDAHTGELLMNWNAVAYAFTGNVNGDVQLEGAYDPFYNRPFKDLTVNSGYGSDVTDEDGNYYISGSGSTTISAQLNGPYVNVNRYDGGDASFSQTSYGVLDIDWTSISQPQERDAYYHVIVVHDYINYVDPSFTDMDFQLPCNINVSGSCNAYWDGSSINFYAAGGGCPNIAQLSTVVYHEYGHGITEYFYYPVDLPYWDETGGLNEGWSDFIANCISDQALMGRGWSGPGTYLRSSDNNAQYPGDECGGEPHCMGDIMVGALWDMRVNLISTHGDGIKPYVDSLWHYARYAKPLNYLDYLWEILLYDDDDGNPLNGTPNYYDICDGFAQHNMDCPELEVGVFITHTPLENTPSTDPYQVDAVITSTDGSITSATIYYSTGGGYTPVSMTNIGGDNYRGFIPGQPLCTTIDYYIYATDNLGYSGRHPETGSHTFFIGYTTTMFSDDIEGGTNGWTHYPVSGSIDQWYIRNHRNHTPGGSNAWKFGSASNPGAYADDADAGLVTPSIHITEGATLTFWMWGAIEQSSSTVAWDGAMVELSINGGGFSQITPVGGYTHTTNGSNSWPNGTPCWSGSFGWTEVEFDLSAYANQDVQLRYRFSSDYSVSYEGWYIDDVLITAIDCGPIATGTLEGTVTDGINPIAGVDVFADDGSGHTGSDVTAGDGTYSMELRVGTYDVSYSHPAYQDVLVTGVVIVENTTTIQDVVMEEIPTAEIDVSPSSITGQAPPGGYDTDILTVSNNGGATLIVDASVSVTPPAPAAGIVKNDDPPVNAEFTKTLDYPEKEPFTGTLNKPNTDIILQGGDNIGNATLITTLPYSDAGTTAGYNDDYDEVCPYIGSTSPDVVYEYTPSVSQIVDITLCNGSAYDTKLYLYENFYNPGNPYACNDDECPGWVSEILGLTLVGGNTYYIVIDGYGGDYGSYVLDITVVGAPPDCPVENRLYSQPPHMPGDSWTAGTSDAGSAEGYLRYESFGFAEGQIDEITFWGLDLEYDNGWYDCTENPMPFTITFYEDNGGTPGNVVQTYTDVPIAPSPTGFYYLGFEMNEYNTTLSPAAAINSGWVSIQGGGDPSCWFLWMSSGTGDGTSLFWNGSYLETVAYDLSLCLMGSGVEMWLSIDPDHLEIPAGAPSQNIDVMMDAVNLTEGTYYGQVHISSNDPVNPNIDVPVIFNVGGSPTTGAIAGLVTDQLSNPISGVHVVAEGTGVSDDTDAGGAYLLANLDPGTYSVSFSHAGYQDTTVTGVEVTAGNTTQLDVMMEEIITEIPTLTEWGMLILTLLLLTMGTVAIIRKRREVPVRVK